VLDLALSRNASVASGTDETTSASLAGSLSSALYLVGNKCTYADLSFVTWAHIGEGLLKQLGEEEHARLDKYPHYRAWMARMEEREVVKSAMARIAKGRAAHSLP
jgi:glutathione S-transferase